MVPIRHTSAKEYRNQTSTFRFTFHQHFVENTSLPFFNDPYQRVAKPKYMLRHIVLPLLLCISIQVFAQQTASQQQKEETAIKTMIEMESRYFWARDFQNWKKAWVHADYAVWIAASRDGIRQYDGWKSWSDNVKTFFEENPDPIPYDENVTKTEYRFRIYGNGAWVSFIQVNSGTRTLETRIMEKHNGQWKIAMAEIIHDINETVVEEIQGDH